MNVAVEDLIEVKLEKEDDFLKVRETLTRIGVASRKDKKLYQSCHILHKKGRYYIVHFKELFGNTIVNLLVEWKLISVVEDEKIAEPIAPLSQIKILPHKDRNEWELVAKYNIGKKKVS